MSAPPKLSVVEQIRARDGDECWLCGFALDFTAKGNNRKAPTKEHLLAQSLGGGDELSNLVLCHPGCNKQLGNRPVADKHKIRAKMIANRARLVANRVEAVPKPAVPSPAGPTRSKAADGEVAHLKAALRRWQIFALTSAGAVLFAVGVAAGLMLGT
jgi:hypothetical protein